MILTAYWSRVIKRFTVGKQNIACMPPLSVGILVGKEDNPC